MKKLADITKIALGSIRRPIFWMINFGVIAVCFLSGPFGTLEALPSGFRLIYWGLIVLTTSMLALWLYACSVVTYAHSPSEKNNNPPNHCSQHRFWRVSSLHRLAAEFVASIPNRQIPKSF